MMMAPNSQTKSLRLNGLVHAAIFLFGCASSIASLKILMPDESHLEFDHAVVEAHFFLASSPMKDPREMIAPAVDGSDATGFQKQDGVTWWTVQDYPLSMLHPESMFPVNRLSADMNSSMTLKKCEASAQVMVEFKTLEKTEIHYLQLRQGESRWITSPLLKYKDKNFGYGVFRLNQVIRRAITFKRPFMIGKR